MKMKDQEKGNILILRDLNAKNGFQGKSQNSLQSHL